MRILHVLDRSLPTIAGYTTRSAALLEQQVALGLVPRALTGVRPRWCAEPPIGPVECLVQLRAHGDPAPAVVRLLDDDTLDVELLAAARGVAPGQAVVVYDGTRVVGSATIDRTRR